MRGDDVLRGGAVGWCGPRLVVDGVEQHFDAAVRVRVPGAYTLVHVSAQRKQLLWDTMGGDSDIDGSS
jgi:hypothetical protein